MPCSTECPFSRQIQLVITLPFITDLQPNYNPGSCQVLKTPSDASNSRLEVMGPQPGSPITSQDFHIIPQPGQTSGIHRWPWDFPELLPNGCLFFSGKKIYAPETETVEASSFRMNLCSVVRRIASSCFTLFLFPSSNPPWCKWWNTIVASKFCCRLPRIKYDSFKG